MRIERSNVTDRSFLNIYEQDFSQISNLYSWNPHNEADWQARAAELQSRFADAEYRNRLADALVAYNRSIGAGSQALASIEQLRNGALAIVTGQQAGLFTGPLYTIYKAITAELLANEYQQRLGVSVIPVFWIASEDHDFLEVNHIFVQTSESLSKIEWSKQETSRKSIGHIKVPEQEVNRLIDELKASTIETEFREQLLQTIYECWQSTDSMADWFGALMAHIFENSRLVFLNPMLHEFRQLSASVFTQGIEWNEAIRNAAFQGAEQVRRCGLEPQVHIMGHSSLLFLQMDNGRYPLDFIDGRFAARGTEYSWSGSELVQIARTAPERMSSNVLLRPIVQDHLLPTLAFVGGGAEVAYHGMLKELFHVYGISMPIIMPRISITVIEKAAAKNSKKYNVSIDSIVSGQDPLQQVLSQLDPVGVDTVFASFFEQIDKLYVKLKEDLVQIDPQLKKLSEENQQWVQQRVESLRQKTYQFHEQKHEIAVRQLQKLTASLYPNGHLQERVLNIFPFLIKYGPQFVSDLRDHLESGNYTHWYLYL
ncbi:bacillithiol biosynthesis cysteine-adding enzyme BshC [Fodinisporobacter ferrooxydans]|uniref:Putative cysteine ligase BshC n=1 Tax=Fodinisporobacter ferrooxydans TaxID=2901836 RepID=A0ABY4CMR7_9BACL|nr:bacillithiol biosynthesis cysteine-adding enzyme BshC [Alicyclobacillaceae bacterium MYW30-H2]